MLHLYKTGFIDCHFINFWLNKQNLTYTVYYYHDLWFDIIMIYYSVLAMRFALLEMKICLARMIAEYNITLGSNTKMPLQFEPRGFSLVPKDGIWLKFEKRKHHKN